MVIAAFAVVFAILGIFSFGMLFVPLAGLCAVLGLSAGIIDARAETVILSLVAAVLTLVGFCCSPMLWLMVAAIATR